MKKKLIAEGKLDKHGKANENTPTECSRNVMVPAGGDSVVASLAAAPTIEVAVNLENVEVEGEKKKKKKDKSKENGDEGGKRKFDDIDSSPVPASKKAKISAVEEVVHKTGENEGVKVELGKKEKKKKKKEKKKEGEVTPDTEKSKKEKKNKKKNDSDQKVENTESEKKKEKKEKKKKKSKEKEDN